MHSEKVYLGSTYSSFKEVTNYAADPADFPAGTVCRLKSDGTISKLKGDGMIVGVSLGKSLSDTERLAVVRCGLKVPVLLADDSNSYAYAQKGAAVWVDDSDAIANVEDGEAPIATTITNGIYVSAALDGINEAGETVKVALIDMQGGL